MSCARDFLQRRLFPEELNTKEKLCSGVAGECETVSLFQSKQTQNRKKPKRGRWKWTLIDVCEKIISSWNLEKLFFIVRSSDPPWNATGVQPHNPGCSGMWCWNVPNSFCCCEEGNMVQKKTVWLRDLLKLIVLSRHPRTGALSGLHCTFDAMSGLTHTQGIPDLCQIPAQQTRQISCPFYWTSFESNLRRSRNRKHKSRKTFLRGTMSMKLSPYSDIRFTMSGGLLLESARYCFWNEIDSSQTQSKETQCSFHAWLIGPHSTRRGNLTEKWNSKEHETVLCVSRKQGRQAVVYGTICQFGQPFDNSDPHFILSFLSTRALSAVVTIHSIMLSSIRAAVRSSTFAVLFLFLHGKIENAHCRSDTIRCSWFVSLYLQERHVVLAAAVGTRSLLIQLQRWPAKCLIEG